ncbi:Brefeldin A resistance protein [Neolecta irregularis DAH-3]|uniref:Brefeldin A resistance protein n=1 Tax=Neolecta irregularis (strain DAH-3) TaxID=1198029 RepID=A0A1U7LUC5_NEOID|nr:Brefeldin A resistance protein [Neolecta irregularis DAH-3]|eukprot:OLL26267.1 Brefeldin A resistance protein [Neolecta irregularis DAH-3]
MPSDTEQPSSQLERTVKSAPAVTSSKTIGVEKAKTETDLPDADCEERKMQQKLRETNLDGQKPEDLDEVKIPAKRSREEDESTEKNDNEYSHEADDQNDTKEETPEPEQHMKPTVVPAVTSSPSPFRTSGLGVSPFSAVSRPMGASPFAAIKKDEEVKKDAFTNSSGGFGAFKSTDMPNFRKFKSPQKKRRKEGETSPTCDDKDAENEDQSIEDDEGNEERKDQFGDMLLQKNENDTRTNSADQYMQVTKPLEEQKVRTGEEDETTLFSVRAKLFILDDTKNWKERGLGSLKINIHENPKTKEIISSRLGIPPDLIARLTLLVMRTDAVFRVILNTPLFAGMTLDDNNKLSGANDLGDKFTRLVVLEEGKPVHLAIKARLVSNANAALDLRSNIRKAIPMGPKRTTLANADLKE